MGLEASMIEVPTRDGSLLALTGGRSDIDCVGTLIPGSILFYKLLSLAKFGLVANAASQELEDLTFAISTRQAKVVIQFEKSDSPIGSQHCSGAVIRKTCQIYFPIQNFISELTTSATLALPEYEYAFNKV